MSNILINHQSNTTSHQVMVDWEISPDNFVEFLFTVKNITPKSDPNFSMDYKKNWGLWDFDVVEVFLQRGENSEQYLEFQTSSLGQPFALLIKKARVEFSPPDVLEVKVQTLLENGNWTSKISVPLSDIPGDGNILRGNCFCCLGSKEQREYYGLNINLDEQADFHRPELFTVLGHFNEK